MLLSFRIITEILIIPNKRKIQVSGTDISI